MRKRKLPGLVRVCAAINPQRWGGSTIERLWATPLPSGLFRLDNIPFYADNLAWHDIVRCTCRNEELWITDVTERSGHSTVRLVLAARDGPSVEAVGEWLDASILEWEGDGDGFFAITIRPMERLDELLKALRPQRDDGVLNFEASYIFDGTRTGDEKYPAQ